ncbi:MAG TPA: hypothetical protein PKG94_12620 [Gordonia sp. (in: high G+C Gram-positive bacteria)]|nr:hypothetical protein [uncultured Gordonia sp.]HNP57785.1 hypothetical protein [Gordonia sp. (in: high G+C Gram-positive bacteria)]
MRSRRSSGIRDRQIIGKNSQLAKCARGERPPNPLGVLVQAEPTGTDFRLQLPRDTFPIAVRGP